MLLILLLLQGFSAGSYTSIFVFRLLNTVLKMKAGSVHAVVGGLAIVPSQIPRHCSGLHIIHVLEDKLCVWSPKEETRKELVRRGARLTLVSSSGMPSAKCCLGKSLHNYCSFVLNHHHLPRVDGDSHVTLQRVLACVPADAWMSNGSSVFLFLGWAIASGALPGGLPALSGRVQDGLRSGSNDAITEFEIALTDLLKSTSLPGCSQQSCAYDKHPDQIVASQNSRSGSVLFDCDGLRSSLKNLLRDVKPENLAFLLDVALPWMTASQIPRLNRFDGQTSWPRSVQTVNGYFELLSGRLGSKTAFIRLHFENARESLWASWHDAEPGFFSGQILHGRFRVESREFDISGVVTAVSRVKNWRALSGRTGHAAVNALTLLTQFHPLEHVVHDHNIFPDIVGSQWQHFSLSEYYKQNTRIVAEPRMKLLNLEDSLLRHVFGCELAHRVAPGYLDHPKFAKAAAMGHSWFLAYHQVVTRYALVMLQVSFDQFSDLKDLLVGENADPILVEAWSPLKHLGEAFAVKFWKFLLQRNSTLLLGVACILSHWSLVLGLTLFFFGVAHSVLCRFVCIFACLYIH